jgi:hypothetical protein
VNCKVEIEDKIFISVNEFLTKMLRILNEQYLSQFLENTFANTCTQYRIPKTKYTMYDKALNHLRISRKTQEYSKYDT